MGRVHFNIKSTSSYLRKNIFIGSPFLCKKNVSLEYRVLLLKSDSKASEKEENEARQTEFAHKANFFFFLFEST